MRTRAFPHFLYSCFLFCLLPSLAFAQDRDVDIQLFRPAVDSRGLLTKNRSETLGHKDLSFGLWLNLADDPLKLDVDNQLQDIAETLVTADFHGSIGFLGFLEAGINLPLTIVNGPDDDPLGGGTLAAQGAGDLGFHLKGMILPQRDYGVGIGALLRLSLPTGGNDFLSSQSTTIAPELIVDTILLKRLKLALNTGAFFRQETQITDVNNVEQIAVGNQLNLGFGAGLIVVPERFDLVAELQILTDLDEPFQNSVTTPVEAIGGLKIFLQGNSFLTIGAGIGLGDAYGAPDFRGFAGITFEPVIGDRDGDGLRDDVDQCPDDPEDFDGFQDEDGCPEPDNDGDGVLDIDDKCPLVPGPFENQGCPNEVGPGDRDGDGFLDDVDQCPDDPEDFDGFQDTDGCPEPDNDGDGLLDEVDACPFEAEDFDDFEDNDGCPEPDNDRDGILDGDDQCPNEPEVFNKYKDEDGCPDDKPAVTLTDTEIVITEQIYFDYNRATIKKESHDILYQVAAVLNDNPQIAKVRVEGHTDGDGSPRYNLSLSDKRAKAVVSFLVSKGKVDRSRLSGKGYGEDCPIADNDTPEGKSTNRRSEFVIMQPGDNVNGICRAQKAAGL